jgi:hypothetical protein
MLTVWGLPAALSVTVRKAERLPLADGVKVMLIVHLAPAPSKVLQVLVCAKSLTLVPVKAMLVILKGTLPVLVSVVV